MLTIGTQVGAGAVARLAIALGAGRLHPSDTLDLGAGVELRVEPGDVVRRGEEWGGEVDLRGRKTSSSDGNLSWGTPTHTHRPSTGCFKSSSLHCLPHQP